MASYNKAHDVRQQQGEALKRQLQVESSYPGGREQMYYDEIRANQAGRLFRRPSPPPFTGIPPIRYRR